MSLPLDTAQELTGTLLSRVIDNLLGRTLLDNAASVHKDHAIGNIARKLHRVGHDHHRHILRGKVFNDTQHLGRQLGVERRGRLVKQDDGLFGAQGTGESSQGTLFSLPTSPI